jgi:hypothetical protein
MPAANQPPRLPPDTVIVPEVLPPDPRRSGGPFTDPPPGPRRRLSKGRLAVAFFVAVISDLLSVWVELLPPLQVALDICTAAILFVVLGWRWPLLIGLVMEAIPGVALFPAWVMVVGAIAMFGSARPPLR